MRGVIYARYSPGPHQTEQSIEGQVADCQQYAEEHGIDIIEIYADRHVSGKSVAVTSSSGCYETRRRAASTASWCGRSTASVGIARTLLWEKWP